MRQQDTGVQLLNLLGDREDLLLLSLSSAEHISRGSTQAIACPQGSAATLESHY